MIRNQAGQSVGAQMTTAADNTDFSGSVTVYVTLDRGTQAAGSVGSGACVNEGHGTYTYAPSQAETDADFVQYTFVGSGARSELVQGYTRAATPDVNVASIASAAVGAIWDRLLTAVTAAGSIGKLIKDFLDVAVSSRSSYAGADSAGVSTLLTRLTTGRAAALDFLDASVASRMPTGSYTDPPSAAAVRAEVDANSTALAAIYALAAAIRERTDGLPDAPAPAGEAVVLSGDERAAIVDLLLTRDWTAVSGEAAHSVLNALRFSRNRFAISAAVPPVLTVYKEDGVTPAWTATITKTAGNPVSGSTPA